MLIEHLSLSFAPGLCALTGETGAGKSILLDALGLALGARADSGLVRRGADHASVSAEFELPAGHPAFALMAEADLAVEDRLVIRRTGQRRRTQPGAPQRSAGLGRPCCARSARRWSRCTASFETHGLMNPQTHRSVLDGFAGLGTEVDRVRRRLARLAPG